jgi:hypothetical protein
VATLLALLRAGEQSAAAALNRIAERLSAGELELAAPRLARLIADEQRHDASLARHAAGLPIAPVGDAATRRFFRRLESREPVIHLARVAALDSCVCQVLSRVLMPAGEGLGPSLSGLLSRIRSDEAEHVRAARYLSMSFGLKETQLRSIDLEVRDAFALLLGARAVSFEALGVDSVELISRIRRER